jgi:serine phosphatase RsbU (regulator of sigma subunit)/ABC-type amino acid transport substrate-binding protein
MSRRFYIILGLLLIQFPSGSGLRGQTNVVVGIYQNEPLVFTDSDGAIKGIYIDILSYIGKIEGWQIEYIAGSWDECISRLEKGEIDLLVAIAYSEERSKRYHFNSQTLVTNWAQVYTQQNSQIQSLLDLTGKKIAALTGDIYYQIFKRVDKSFKIKPVFVEVDVYDDILKLLDSRAVDAGIVSRIYGMYHEKDYQIKKSPINFSPVELRFAAPKDLNDPIIDSIDRHLKELKKDQHSIYYRSLNLWTEGVHKLVFPGWLKPFWVLSFIAGLLALLTGGTLILRWQVRVRTEALRESIAARERIESDLRIAHEIQMDLVPKVFPPFPDRSDFDLYAVLEPAKQVGGDFYDFFFIDPHRLCFLIGDVSDKGVPAALLMARTKTLIKSAAKSMVGPDKILDIVNKEVSINNDLFMFVTVFCGILKTDTGEVWYTNAGHNSPLMVFLRKDPAFIAGTGSTALGIDEDSTFKKTHIMLKSGYTLFMYTDGVTEAFNKDEETFSEERLIQALSSYRHASTRDMVLSILKKIKAFAGDMPQTDDIAILALKYTPSEA